jgi:plasmid maintenance system antidote protein VapI
MSEAEKEFVEAKIEPAGLILDKEYLVPLNISSSQLAKATGLRADVIKRMREGLFKISASDSILIGRALGVSDFFFFDLECNGYKRRARRNHNRNVECLVKSE